MKQDTSSRRRFLRTATTLAGGLTIAPSHVLDGVFWALDLGAPRSIQARGKTMIQRSRATPSPRGDVITFDFPATAKRGPITLHWHSGTEPIPRPADLPSGEDPDANSLVTPRYRDGWSL